MRFVRLTLNPRKRKTFLLFLVIAVLWLTACSRSTSTLPMAPLDQMPPEVQKAPVSVQDAYRFAVANPEVLSQVPCYCGCGAVGHTSNYDCYVKDVQPSGSIEFDSHALGCSICVDITRDVMRLTQEGKALEDIQTYINRTYSQYGPPTPLKP